mmetsp:Transcript_110876/g.320460  ORF Transcript_110876/g.320460 Transcript_110876/m.320460 type:complete len:423 (+) Transcript_110876:101-1369(+)
MPAIAKPAPAIDMLRNPRDRAETFAAAREWMKVVRQHDQLETALRELSREHRHAILRFMSQETAGGVRAPRAKELLSYIADLPEFVGLDPAAEWVDDPVEGGAVADTGPVLPEDLDRIEPPASSGLPSMAELRGECLGMAPTEAFQALRAWVKQQQRPEDRLAEGGAELSSTYRKCVFEFLCGVSRRRCIFRAQARDMLLRLWEHPTWRAGGAFDQAALDKMKGLWAQDDASPKEYGDSSAMSPGSEATASPAVGDIDDATGSESGDGGDISFASAEVPPREVFEDPHADAGALLWQLSAWVEAASRSEGGLENAAARLNDDHRRAMLHFLCRDVAGPDQKAVGVTAPVVQKRRWPSMPSSMLKLRRRRSGRGDLGIGIEAEHYYVLQALAKAGACAPRDAEVPIIDQTTLSRALAQLPKAG